MNLDGPRARIDYRGTVISRAKQLAFKAVIVLGGVVALASAFVLSLVFVAIALAAVLVAGGYLWWKTRDLRRQMRAHVQAQPRAGGVVIEGEVISSERTRR